ncbi:Sterol O-acyltransferase 2 [Hypsizygus marmoreus]|uniref:O-acyltransferase n=1 Tax=Hypsizygus marmoreus TaxID=39966 RepID=A0A369JFZ7_HYPMA|nr:Sterol O-acyltransferase 2 [Hypsizygus marmoreus]
MSETAHAPPADRTKSGEFKTSEGILYVSRPYRSKTSKKLRALITFAPRKSHFDIGNELSGANEFRGFFSLFWISTFILVLRVYVHGIETSGRPLDFGFASMFSEDAIVLAISDAVLVLSTSLCVPFALAMKKRWFMYHWTGVIIQHLFQIIVLTIAITWTFNRKWPWVQSGFLTLHSLVMIMKMHSYMTVNGHLQMATIQSEELFKELRQATDFVGGWDQAISDAKSHKAELDALTGMTSSSSNASTPIGTPEILEGSTTSYTDTATANALRKRLMTISRATGGNIAVVDIPDPGAVQQPSRTDDVQPEEPHPLVDHPNIMISEIARDYSELRSELTSTGPNYVTWPNNITLKNFAVYQLIPTLVYELEYPRTDRIRPIYVFEKTVATFGTFALLYTVTETFILPYTPKLNQSILRSLLDLALPFMMAYLLLFFIIFECICNAFAELSYFADRQFYDDWYDHLPLRSGGLSRTWAMFLTFLLSACVHELVMIVVTQKFRFYLFMLQIVQIPMIIIGRIPMVKRNKLLGNIVFWLGLYAGFPLLCVAYVAY